MGPDKNSFTIDGLTPKKKYKFRVKAVNKEGESEPLETDEPILARNPYGNDEKYHRKRPIRHFNTVNKSKIFLCWPLIVHFILLFR